ncbi:hypothetical protein QUB63_05055 [Microcoleus sp. ARI1-B5]
MTCDSRSRAEGRRQKAEGRSPIARSAHLSFADRPPLLSIES